MTKKTNLIILALLLLSLAIIVIDYFAAHSFREYLFNSDTLYLPTLFSDLFTKGGNIADWYLSPAPYFFPDYLIFLLAYLFGPSPYSQIAIFSIIQTLATFFAIWFLAVQISNSEGFLRSSIITIVLIWLGLSSGVPFVFLFISVYHYGIFISTIILVALWLRYEQAFTKKRTGKTLLLLTVTAIIFVSTLSDNLFIIQAAVPLTATAIIIEFARRDFGIKRKVFLLFPILASGLGSLSYKFLVEHPTRYGTDIGLEKVHANLVDMYAIFNEAIMRNPVYGIVFLIYLGIVIYVSYKLINLPECEDSEKQLIWLTLFSFLAFCCTVGALALVTNLPIGARYIIPALSWSVIVVLLFLGHYLGKRYFAVGTTLSTLAVVHLIVSSYELVISNGLSSRYYPEQMSCIDDALEEANVDSGISQYWYAKYLQNFSRLDLNIAQHTDTLQEFHWITSKEYFKDNYDFAIVTEKTAPPHRITSKELSRLNSVPERVVSCGDKSVHIYGKDKLQIKKIVNIGDSYQWQACELPTIIGTKTVECEVIKQDVTQSGYLTFGPYQALPAGHYSFEIAYSSSEVTPNIVGTWDVVLALPSAPVVLEKGNISGTDGIVRKITGEFRVDSNLNLTKVEIRTLAHKNVDLRVIHIQITKVNGSPRVGVAG